MSVPGTGVRHPLVDWEHPEWVHSETRASVVHLSEARSDLFVQAAERGLRVVLVTHELSALTEPYHQAMKNYRGAWVVRSSRNTLRDGITGRRLEAIAEVLKSVTVTNADQIAVEYLQPSRTERLEVAITLTMRHRAAETTVLGGAIESLSRSLRREPPSAWGIHEPANVAWDREHLTDFARSRMPADSQFVIVGNEASPMVATMTARRTRHGIEEITKAFIGMGPPDAESAQQSPGLVVDALARLADEGMPLVAVALARPAAANQVKESVMQIPATPLGLLIGPPGVKALGLDSRRYLRDFGAIVVGRPRVPGLLFPLGTAQRDGWQQTNALLSSFDQQKLSASLRANDELLSGLDTRGASYAE